MNCETAREAISARLDGEGAGVDVRALDAHLSSCAACCSWQAAAHDVTRHARLQAARQPARRTEALVGAVLDRSRPPRRPLSLMWARGALLLLGLTQALLTAPELLLGRDHGAPVHVAHEMGAFAMALGIGFVAAALRPDRARGMRAVVGVTAALLVLTAADDLVRGSTGVADELPHLIAVVGALLVAYIAVAAPLPEADPSSSWTATILRSVGN